MTLNQLNAFIKLKQLAVTGGQAKLLVRSGAVSVNGAVETRNKKKLYAGDKINVGGKVYSVEESVA